MSELYNPEAIERIRAIYPIVASGAVQLIHSAEAHESGSAEIALSYDKPEDRILGKYEVKLVLRVHERGEASHD
jgi:hypothetical protein